VADWQPSALRIFNAAALIDLVAAADSAVIALVAEDSVVAVIDLAAAALAGSAGAAGSEVGAEN
jgi:hypothetical protein